MSVDLDAIAARFNACTLPQSEWTHQAHLAVGMWHIDRYGAEDALPRMRTGIRSLNDSHGTLNSATSGYHETITRAYLILLAEFMASCPDTDLSERFVRLRSTILADRAVLLRFYSKERLMSELARAQWVEPDLAPVQLPVNLTDVSGGSEPGNQQRVG